MSMGKGAIILPHGVLFRGNKEADIRRNLIERGLIKGIIGLPANLFYGTGIPACILVIDKENAHVRTGIFMIDASKGFRKDGPKNRLRAQDIHKIVDVFNKQLEVKSYSRMVPVSEIGSPSNHYNLNIPRYIDSREPEDLHDLDAHLNGGIPNRDINALNEYWTIFPSLRRELFKSSGRAGYSEARFETQQVKDVILCHEEFQAYKQQLRGIMDSWRKTHESLLRDVAYPTRSPKSIIHTLSEDLLARFSDQPLLDPYDIYQQLMDYWQDVMQDDVYLIAADGWLEAARPRRIIQDKTKKVKETPDLIVKRQKYKMDLVPPALIVESSFPEEQAETERLQATKEAAARRLAEFIEEHSGEDGLLEEATNDRGKVTKSGVKTAYKALPNPDSEEEGNALLNCWVLMGEDSQASKTLREAKATLNLKVLNTYAKLDELEIKRLVVEDKWFASISKAITAALEDQGHQLAIRVGDLTDRYAKTLRQMERDVEDFKARVGEHLQTLALEWAE